MVIKDHHHQPSLSALLMVTLGDHQGAQNFMIDARSPKDKS